MLRSWAYVRGPGCSSRWRPRLGPRLERTQALCGPCVNRRRISPSVCGRRTRAELHIRDIRPRMHLSSAAPRRGASRTHPCCSFPCSALRAHGTLHSPVRGKHLCVLCTTNLELRQTLYHFEGDPPRLQHLIDPAVSQPLSAQSGRHPVRCGQSLRASHPRDARQASEGRREDLPQRRGRGCDRHHKGPGAEGGHNETLISATPPYARLKPWRLRTENVPVLLPL